MMARKCEICERPLRTGRKYCYGCRSLQHIKKINNISPEELKRKWKENSLEEAKEAYIKSIEDEVGRKQAYVLAAVTFVISFAIIYGFFNSFPALTFISKLTYSLVIGIILAFGAFNWHKETGNQQGFNRAMKRIDNMDEDYKSFVKKYLNDEWEKIEKEVKHKLELLEE